MIKKQSYTAELHLSGFTGQWAIQICGKFIYLDFSLKTGYIGGLKFSCYYLQYVLVSEPFNYAYFEVLETVTLYCTRSDDQ